MTHQFKQGDRALVLPRYEPLYESFAKTHRFNYYDTVFLTGSKGELTGNLIFKNRWGLLQSLFPKEYVLLAPHHTGLPDYLDAE